ncbi:MAG: methylglyoxal synthase [Bacteroidetes bacterium]|nr:MAG: methylglyoxal synthase [Bacteroidota bacterium]
MKKRIALVAHDRCKQQLVEWASWNWEELVQHQLYCTGTTGSMVQQMLEAKIADSGQDIPLQLHRFKSGPLGGDQQIGACIAEGKIDFFLFFWDPMTAQPHDVDVKALLRIATMYNIPTACNRSTADFLISSPLFHQPIQRGEVDFSDYLNRDPSQP